MSQGNAEGSKDMEQERALTWLLAVDGSRNAVRAARYVARVAGNTGVGEIQLLNVQPPEYPGKHASRGAAPEPDEAANRDATAALRILERAALPVRLHAHRGANPAATIVDVARRLRVHEIVMGTRGLSALGTLGLGSVAYKVVYLTRRPVTLVPSSRDGHEPALPSTRRATSILLAVDGSRHALRAVTYVCSLHRAGLPLHVHLLNVQPRIVSGNVRRFVSRAEIGAYQREEGELALRAARRRLDRAGIKYASDIRTGAFAETIVQLAGERRCTRIVLGTRGLGAVSGLVLGSVTYGVVHLAAMPVTLVK
jgi:nucleotide-binding universal stress UspA family protein